MTHRRHRSVRAAVLAVLAVASLPRLAPAHEVAPAAPTASSLAPLPLAFEPNRGQADAGVRFVANGPGKSLALTDTEAVTSLPGGILRMRWSDRPGCVVAEAALPGRSNYFIGRDPERWIRGVPQFGRVRYDNVAPGVSLVFHGERGALEYDLLVAPGADPETFALTFDGAAALAIDAEGDLVIALGDDRIVHRAPVAFQTIAGERRPVAARYRLEGDVVRFAVGSYDHGHELVVDPVLAYATYLGGSSTESPLALAVDPSGNIYVAGSSGSTDFIVGGRSDPAGSYVIKLDPTGRTMLYSTWLGGSRSEAILGLVATAAGEVYAAGETQSFDFPVTPGAFQTVHGNSDDTPIRGWNDAFVARLAADGATLVYATYLGGGYTLSRETEGSETAWGLAVDSSGSAYVCGQTDAGDFPVVSPYQATLTSCACSEPAQNTDAFVTKLRPDGSGADYSTYIGGRGMDVCKSIAVSSSGNAYITGTEYIGWGPPMFPTTFQIPGHENGGGFVSKLDATGRNLVYSTQIRAASRRIAVSGAGEAHLATTATGAGYPVVNPQQAYAGSYDGVVLKLDAAGRSVVYATYLGGSAFDQPYDIALDGSGTLFVVGRTNSWNYPTLLPFQPLLGGREDNFIARYDRNGDLLWSSFLGGSGSEWLEAQVRLTAAGVAVVATSTTSADFPVTADALQLSRRGTSDVGLARIAPDPTGQVRAWPRSAGNAGRSSGVVYRLDGSWFDAATTVRLVRAGELDVAGLDPQLLNDNEVAVTFDLTGVTPGSWDLVVTGPGTLVRTHPAGFTVVPGIGSALSLQLVGPRLIRDAAEETYLVAHGNRGDADATGLPLWLSGLPLAATWSVATVVPPPVPVAWDPIDWSGVRQGFTTGGDARVPLLIGLAPAGAAGGTDLTLAAPNGSSFDLAADLGHPLLDAPAGAGAACVAALAGTAAERLLSRHLGVPLDPVCAAAIPGDTDLLLAEVVARGRGLAPDVIDSLQWIVQAIAMRAATCSDARAAGFVPTVVGDDVAAVFAGDAPRADFCPAVPGMAGRDAVHVDVVSSMDPNDKYGPGGAGPERWIDAGASVNYLIRFENLETATAAANQVVVTDSIDLGRVDPDSLALGPIGFGDWRLVPPAGAQSFVRDVDLRPTHDVLARVEVGFDRVTGQLSWRLRSVSPATGLPVTGAAWGFLPPNVQPPEGQGFVSFSARLRPGLASGEVLANQARIVFDANPPIDTPVWSNALDAEAPESNVDPIPDGACRFDVHWQGNDFGGSGIASYTVLLSVNGAPAAPWLTDTTATSAAYVAAGPGTYAFTSIATDRCGHVEPVPAVADAVTTVTDPGVPPDDVGNTLRAVREGTDLRVHWGAAARAVDYLVMASANPATPRDRLVTVGVDGDVGVLAAIGDAEPYFTVAARSGCGLLSLP